MGHEPSSKSDVPGRARSRAITITITVPCVDAADLIRPLEDQKQFDGHAHSGLSSHEHGDHSHEHFHEHDTGWQSFVLRSRDPQDAEKLKAAVREVSLKEPILRAKGFAVIAGQTSSPRSSGCAQPGADATLKTSTRTNTESTLVFIGHHPQSSKNLSTLITELTGVEWQ